MKILIVTEKYNNQKLNDFLFDNFNGLSSSTFYKTLRKKDIRINNIRISENCLLRTGDEIKIYITDDFLYKKIDIPIIYEDENIVIFNKPSGIEVTGENSVTSFAKQLFLNKNHTFIEPCHRLDRNTSGLVLFAKNEPSLNELLNAFKTRFIEKHYLCIVYGIPHNSEDTLKSYLFKDSKKSVVYISDIPKQGYQTIITKYKILKTNKNKNICLLDVLLETGKTHQIRAHLAHIGNPIIGDGKYGINTINKKFNLKTQQLTSYSISFNFNKNSKLYYLNNTIFKQSEMPFNNLI